VKRAIFDYSRLKGRIKEKFDTQERFASELNVSIPALIKKLNNKSQFTQTEIDRIRLLLDISSESLDSYFFNKKG